MTANDLSRVVMEIVIQFLEINGFTEDVQDNARDAVEQGFEDAILEQEMRLTDDE